MLSAMLADGISVFAHPGHTARRRLDSGLSQPLFARTLIVTAVASVVGLLLPEINGVSAAMDQISGSSRMSSVCSRRPGLAVVVITMRCRPH